MDSEKRIEAVWCIDSRTGRPVLIDLLTNKILIDVVDDTDKTEIKNVE